VRKGILQGVELHRIRFSPFQPVRLVRRDRRVACPGAGCLAEGADLFGLPPGPNLPGKNRRPVLLDLLLASPRAGRVPAAPLFGLTQIRLPLPAVGFRCRTFEILQ
jgi:hypothetical protein